MKLLDFVSSHRLTSQFFSDTDDSPLLTRHVLSHLAFRLETAHVEKPGQFKLSDVYRETALDLHRLVLQEDNPTKGMISNVVRLVLLAEYKVCFVPISNILLAYLQVQ
jgi:hypothetical protein